MADSCNYYSVGSLKNFTQIFVSVLLLLSTVEHVCSCVPAKTKVVQAIFVRLSAQEYKAVLFCWYFHTTSKLAVSLNGRQMLYLTNLYEIFIKFGLAACLFVD